MRHYFFQMHSFVNVYPDLGTGTRAFYQAIEKTKSNIRWMDMNYDIIKKWLIANNHWLTLLYWIIRTTVEVLVIQRMPRIQNDGFNLTRESRCNWRQTSDNSIFKYFLKLYQAICSLPLSSCYIFFTSGIVYCSCVQGWNGCNLTLMQILRRQHLFLIAHR